MVSQEPAPYCRSRQYPDVPEPPYVQRVSGRRARPRVHIVERNESLDSVGLAQAQPESRLQAPVMADQKHPRKLKRREKGQHVAGQALIVVAAKGGVSPPESPQIGTDDAVALGEVRNDVTPGIPVLWPTMEENERRARLTGSSNVHPQPGGLDDLVIDSRNKRQVIQHDRASLRPLQRCRSRV